MNTFTTDAYRPSLLRLLIVAGCVAAIVVAGSRWAAALIVESRAEPTNTWFAPYVDVTLTPMFHFEDANEQPSDAVVLGFIVADPDDRCAPSWGTYYSLDAAARALDLDRRIVRLRERGGDAIVSFGGALNDELAIACDDTSKLVAAYQAVIDRYNLTAIDFDIEGSAIANQGANGRRAAALLQLQRTHPNLEIWYTLPVAPHGLTSESVTLIDELLGAGVVLSGVNVMTMNFAESRGPSVSMRDASIEALTATWQQLDGAYRRAGIERSDAELWRMLGATPMIGQNDVAGDVFTLKDADGLMEFARSMDLGRLSFWSANRDVQCGAVVADSRASNTCSGVNQEPLEFANVFGAGQHSRTGGASTPPGASDGGDSRIDGLMRDDPRTSPYPLWRSPKAYEEGAKVVWQGRVYEAKWWTQGDQPDAPVKHVWETPWRYLGPVLESDRVAVRALKPLADGSRPRWTAEAVYVAGNEIEHEGKAFRAKWWTQGHVPREDSDQPYDNPWEYLGEVNPVAK